MRLADSWLKDNPKMFELVATCRMFEGDCGLYMANCLGAKEAYMMSDFMEAEEWHLVVQENLEIYQENQPTGERKCKTL